MCLFTPCSFQIGQSYLDLDLDLNRRSGTSFAHSGIPSLCDTFPVRLSVGF